MDRGVFCACLPTEQQTGLPFHITADFFPYGDRKRIHLETDYQSDWDLCRHPGRGGDSTGQP